VLPAVFTVLFDSEHVNTFAKVLETEQASDTVPLKLFTGAMSMVADAVLPGWGDSEVGFAVIAISPDHCSTKLCASIEPQPVVWS
jgi:hypothetical protein